MFLGRRKRDVAEGHVACLRDRRRRSPLQGHRSTLGGADLYQYPAEGSYYVLEVGYRAAFGSVFGAFFTFSLVATFVWGGLAVALRLMLSDDDDDTVSAKDLRETTGSIYDLKES